MANRGLNEIYLEDVAGIGAARALKSGRPYASVAGNQFAITHRQAMGVGGTFHKLRRLQQFAGCRGIFYQARRRGVMKLALLHHITVNIGRAGDHPDGATWYIIGPRNAVPAVGCYRNHEFRCPTRRINAQDPFQPVGDDPKLAGMKHQPMAATAIVGPAQWNLAMRYLPAVQVDLIYPLVSTVGAHPDMAIAEGKARGVA